METKRARENTFIFDQRVSSMQFCFTRTDAFAGRGLFSRLQPADKQFHRVAARGEIPRAEEIMLDRKNFRWRRRAAWQPFSMAIAVCKATMVCHFRHPPATSDSQNRLSGQRLFPPELLLCGGEFERKYALQSCTLSSRTPAMAFSFARCDQREANWQRKFLENQPLLHRRTEEIERYRVIRRRKCAWIRASRRVEISVFRRRPAGSTSVMSNLAAWHAWPDNHAEPNVPTAS
jgi:hypothetical protein